MTSELHFANFKQSSSLILTVVQLGHGQHSESSFSMQLLMITQREGSSGQSVHNIVTAVMLVTLKNLMENLAVVFHYPAMSLSIA